MKKKVKLLVTLALGISLVGGLIGCNTKTSDNEQDNTQTITVSHRGGETDVSKNPKNVVVLDYGSLDILNEMGVDSVSALPKKSLPDYLNEYNDEKYTDLGSVKEFNLEAVNELNPDLIIIEGRQADSYDEFSKIAPTIYLGSDGANYLETLKNNVTVLAQIFDKEDVAKEKIEEIENRMNSIKEKVKADNLNALMTMVSDGSMSVYGEGSRFNIIYNELGFMSADSSIEISNHGQSISNEYLVSKNPDYLFVIDKGAMTGGENQPAKEIIENELVKTTDTYKNGNIVYLDPQTWYVGGAGIKAANEMLNEVEEALK